MFTGSYNKMNMLGMNTNMLGMGGCGSNFFGSNNILGMLFSGTNSIFGGFNFNNYNMMGGCSLFTNCNGSVNYDAMAGFAVGGVLLNIAGGIASQAIADKKANSTESIQADVNGIQEQIDAEIEKLGADSESKALSWSTTNEPKWQEAINAATKNKSDAEKSLLSLNETIANLKAKTTLTDTEKIDYEKAIAEQKQLTADLVEGGKYDKAIEEAEKAQKARQEEIEKIQAELNELIDKRNNAQDALNESILDKADGTSLGRISQEKYAAKFKKDNDGNLTDEIDGKQDFSRRDLKRAIANYSNATGKQKDIYKNQFNKIYDYLAKNDPDELKGMKDAKTAINA